MNERTTRTIARSFTPDFGYRMEFILPLVIKGNVINRVNDEFSGTLAECLEFGEVLFEIWYVAVELCNADLIKLFWGAPNFCGFL